MAQQQPAQVPERPADYSQVEERFSDVIEVHVNPWSAAITFGIRATREPDTTRYEVRMRMPLQQAKALAVLLLRNIRAYEEQTGSDITLPRQVLDALNIPVEDWQRFTGGA